MKIYDYLYLCGVLLGSSCSPVYSNKRGCTKSLSENLRTHIEELSENIGIRNAGEEKHYKNLKEAAKYIQDTFKKIGFTAHMEPYEAKYENKQGVITTRLVDNIEVVIPGQNISEDEGSIIIGAHYDTVDTSPGADDNASSIAALLEIARFLHPLQGKNKKTIKLVAFPNEEVPYSLDQKGVVHYNTTNMGSAVYASQARERGEKIDGMIALESIGYYSEEPKSQKYPFPKSVIKWWLSRQPNNIDNESFRDEKGNYILFVSNFVSKNFMHKCLDYFNKGPKLFPFQSIWTPQFLVPDIKRSDHGSFWNQNYTAIMITGSPNLRNPNYHKSTDRKNTINYDKLTDLVTKLQLMIKGLLEIDD